jgi:hypothetical protein
MKLILNKSNCTFSLTDEIIHKECRKEMGIPITSLLQTQMQINKKKLTLDTKVLIIVTSM